MRCFASSLFRRPIWDQSTLGEQTKPLGGLGEPPLPDPTARFLISWQLSERLSLIRDFHSRPIVSWRCWALALEACSWLLRGGALRACGWIGHIKHLTTTQSWLFGMPCLLKNVSQSLEITDTPGPRDFSKRVVCRIPLNP